jgi:type I restriction enzyme R subunit
MAGASKKGLTEQQIREEYIDKAVARRWDFEAQVGIEVPITKGQIIVRGRMTTRGESKRADYILFHKPNLPIAIIEAKDNSYPIGGGMQQALVYAEMLDIPFAYSSNGDGFLEHDRTGKGPVVERYLDLDAFPSPEELWRRYCAWKGIGPALEPVVTQSYWSDGSDKAPRYYQTKAINRVVELVAKGEPKLLLVMATGTGKTFTAFQIIWRLWKSGVKKRILFLADRNILVDQTKTNDFKPFGGKMTKIANRKVDKSFEIYLALYQGVSGTEEADDVFKQFSPTFFDLIVIDECHRGSAADNSAWRRILDYFGTATQIGLTATPKETHDVSTTNYFGKAVYTYSLKQGIEDGFLAPYKVVRIDLDKDVDGYAPGAGKLDKHGVEIEDRVYEQKDFDRKMVLEKRTGLVAAKVTEFLKATSRMAKTIVFCEDIDHAERMRAALVNENADLAAANRKYVMRITGDNPEGKAELDNFINPDEDYPVLVTTSKLLTTGVDAQTCAVIVLDQTIRSMSEFKQIVGRGTRVNEEHGKLYFTILDFRKATEHFADPDFDGQPVQIYVPKPGESPVPPDDPTEPGGAPGTPEGEVSPGGEDGAGEPGEPRKGGGRREKYVVGDVAVHVVSERVQYYGKNGQLVTESLRDYARNAVREEYTSLDGFLKSWSEAERKQAIVDELAKRGVFFEELAREVGKDFGAFDLVCHIAFDRAPLTRKERAARVRSGDYFAKYGVAARAVLEALLDKYADEGVDDIENMKVLTVQPLGRLGTPMEIVGRFGDRAAYLSAVHALEAELYKAS